MRNNVNDRIPSINLMQQQALQRTQRRTPAVAIERVIIKGAAITKLGYAVINSLSVKVDVIGLFGTLLPARSKEMAGIIGVDSLHHGPLLMLI